MNFTKEQVEKHIAGVEKRLKNQGERMLQGYVLAKLCYQAGMHEDGIRYLSGYLSVKPRDYKAQKLMGQLYEARDDIAKAMEHYQKSLNLKKDQREVIAALSELCCKAEGVRRDMEMVFRSHPVHEKLLAITGKPDPASVENMLSKQLASSQDIDIHIKQVKLYAESGRQMTALQYCQALNNTEAFFHHMEWQLCCADVAEACFETLQSSGKSEPAAMLEVLVTLLECFTRIFELRISGLFVAADQYALLLKYDRLLSVGVKLISGQRSSIYTVVLRELAGQFYLMAGQFLHLCWLKAVEDRVQTGANSDIHMKLSVACLMASLKALPPSLLCHGEKEVKVMERWHLLACSRLCIVGHQLDLFKRHSPNYSESLDHFDEGQHLLAKALFMGDWASSTFVKLGSQKINYSLQQSFVAMDDALKTLRPNLPNADELLVCDEAFIKTHGPNVKAIVWLCLVYMAVDVDPPVTEWLATLFPDMNQATRDLKNCEVSTLSLHDLEAFLALVTYQTVVSCGPSDALSRWPEDAADWLLPHMAQKDWFPYCLAIPESDLSWWKCVIEQSLSVYKAFAVKRELQEGLGKIRAARPLRLETGQLTTLARYFKLKADRMIEMGRDDPLSYRSVIMEFVDRSCYYWTQLVAVVEETSHDLLSQKEHTQTPSRASAASKEADSHLVLKSGTAGLLEEATMSLAGAAMYRQDTTKALLLYDKVKTPHAAFNQSKIYCLLAGNTAANGVEGREENLQKALDMVTRAIERLPSTGDPELREQLESHKNELEQLVSDIRPNGKFKIIKPGDSMSLHSFITSCPFDILRL
ncbi:hypothetical protein EMCRGX_G025173 [Ephydatia muelleri]